jgi:hypothetical protein
MPRYALILALVVLSGCSAGAAKFAGPDDSAPVWDLNPGKWPGTNDLIHEPTVQPKEAYNGYVGF